jgi:hypothetical protein
VIAIVAGWSVGVGTAHATRPVAADRSPTRAPEGVACPPDIGSFNLAPDISRVGEDPLNRSIECWYRDPAGEETPLFGYWTLYRPGPDDTVIVDCTPRAGTGFLKSKTHAAYVSWANPRGVPVGTDEAARELLAQAEQHSLSCVDSPTTSAATTPATVHPTVRKELCAQAKALFEGPAKQELEQAGFTDPAKTGLRVDGDDLLADFQAAVARYDRANPDDSSFVSDGTPFAGEAGAANWLAGHGGGLPSPFNSAYVTGNEGALYKRIVAEAEAQGSKQRPGRLTPGEVFEASLIVNHGSINDALLTAHNLLRSSARNDVAAAPDVRAYENYIPTRYLVQLRDGVDNGGPWYHMFGTAYFEVVAKGDWGPWIAGGATAALWGAGIVTGGGALALGTLSAVATAWQHTSQASGTTVGSRIANGVEQMVRESRIGGSNSPDPEKFCFNVWGAQIGAKLYKAAPYRTTRRFRGLFSSLPEPSPSPPPRFDPLERIGSPRFVNAMGSPFSVWWTSGTMQMLLDQGSSPNNARLIGGVPGFMTPIYEGDSWGAVWTDPGNDSQSVTFEATHAGAVLHFVRTDTQTGQAAFYEATATRAHQRFSVNLDPVTVAPSFSRDDGLIVKPTLVALDLVDAATTSTTADRAMVAAASQLAPGSSASTSNAPWLLLVGASLLVLVVAALWRPLRRGRRRPEGAE